MHTYKPDTTIDVQIPGVDDAADSTAELLDDEQRAALVADEREKMLTLEERQALALENDAEENLPLWTLIKTYKFSALYALVVCHMFYGYYMSNQFKQYGFTGGIDDKTLTMIGSCGALFNGCFKVFWASLLDCYNFKPIYSIVLTIQITCLVAVHWAVNNSYTYFIVICLSFMCDGSMTSMIPVVANVVWGTKRGSSVYGYLFSTFGVASMLGTLLVTTC